ncbi:glycosyl hydrolase [Panacibacter ginsenosidivorans]|uniref:Glycosyl hydrolase n=1 Tax=Panacibacter ginsenosidivorans TaxID=1813871 RepID=A0A5B8V878_9BACT|nr:glycoside hydrolase family 30 protein [Panacibacter ginsenosidivorans]QEC66916.1 glycosyl hydrolase [Panacibacter ginsenosidivorans]
MKKICLLAGLAASLINASNTKAQQQKIIVYTTAENTNLRITPTDTLSFSDFGQPLETQPCIFVDPAKMFQTFIGIGGALTDASAETFYKLPADKQKELLQNYFDPVKGIGYTLGRTNINSCDFSSDSYMYVQEDDKDLKTFSITHDEKYKIPFIKQAIAAAGGRLIMFASPWSPPAFMKTNNDILHGGKLKPEFYQSWADYYIKFFQAYAKDNIPFWGLTVQNEPMAVQKWESCNYSAEEERDFIKNYLGPTLQNAGMGEMKLIAWDHNRDLMYQRASVILSDPGAARYVWGIGFHWYESWTGGGKIFDNVKRVSESFPDKQLIFTEGCAESFKASTIDDWQWGEAYGRNMINDFNSGTCAWTDWNILLDEKGGPNHVGNFCFAPVHADTKTGELHYLNSFYYIGHFSKFIRPGAHRIISSSSRGQLLTTAFINTDGTLVVVVMNQSGDTIPYRLWLNGKAAETKSLPHSMQTFVVQ